jgi:hypothetical protein
MGAERARGVMEQLRTVERAEDVTPFVESLAG